MMESLPTNTATNASMPLNIEKENFQILLAEDDNATRQLLQFCLERDGYQVISVSNGQEALLAFAANPVDMVILDVGMPLLDGWTACSELRKRTDVPVMILTGHNTPEDIVRGIDLGADSYVTKPFTLKEIRARVQAVLRRATQKQHRNISPMLTYSGIAINTRTHEVTVYGKKVDLTPNEYRMLTHFMHNPDKAISKEELLAAVWNYESEPCEDLNFVRVTILRLRNKMEADPTSPKFLKTIHGRGYKLCPDIDPNTYAAQPQSNVSAMSQAPVYS